MDDQDGMGIDGALFQTELLQLDTLGKKRIEVWINSPGGVVTDGYSIYSAILKSKTPVDTCCVGAAASIAGVIFQAGRKRIMADYGWLMYHNPFGSDDKVMLKTMRESIVTMIEARCGMDEQQVAAMMSRDTYIGSDEAFKMKLCDEIDSSVELNTKYLKKITDVTQFYRECNNVLNSINNLKSENMSFGKVTMRLKLNDAATEDNVVKAIDEIENRAVKAEAEIVALNKKAADKAKADDEEMDKLKDAMNKTKSEYDKATAAYKDAKEKLDAMEKDKKSADDKLSEEKAKNMVDDFAKAGRIKNEETSKLKWVNMAKADFEGTKAMIEELPLNKAAVVIPVENKLPEGALPTSAVGLMVKNRLARQKQN